MQFARAKKRSATAVGVYGATLNQAGTYTYHCSIHGSAGAGMHGAIVVR